MHRPASPALVLAALLALACAVPAAAASRVRIEPDLGFRTFTGTVRPYYAAGPSVGANVVVPVRTSLAFVAHGDLSVHGARGPALDRLGRAQVVAFDVGTRYDLRAKVTGARLHPWVGVGVGTMALDWDHTDPAANSIGPVATSITAWTVDFVAGTEWRMAPRRMLGLRGRFAMASWDGGTRLGGETPPLHGDALQLAAQFGFAF